MELAVRHCLPGRVRLHVPKLCQEPSLADAVVAALRDEPGIKSARLNYACASLVVEYDASRQPFLQTFLTQLRLASQTGIISFAEGSNGTARGSPERALKPARQSDARNSKVPTTKSEVPGFLSAHRALTLPTLSLAMAFSTNPFLVAVNFPLMLWNAIPTAQRAWTVWSTERRLNVDFLDALAIAGLLATGNPVAASIVTWLIRLGDWIRDLTAAGSRRALGELLEFQSKNAWIKSDGQIISIPASELTVGDLVVVYPGEMISVDGEIVEGLAAIDQKTITGEGLPVNRGKGEAAFAATVIREGQLTLRATRVGTDTTAGQIAHLVESAPIGDTRMQNHAELPLPRACAVGCDVVKDVGSLLN
jgi:cation transport ATPase